MKKIKITWTQKYDNTLYTNRRNRYYFKWERLFASAFILWSSNMGQPREERVETEQKMYKCDHHGTKKPSLEPSWGS